MSESFDCPLCQKIRPFEARDRDELQAMLNGIGQGFGTLKAHIHQGHSRAEFYRYVEALERDLTAIKERISTDGEQWFEPDVPF